MLTFSIHSFHTRIQTGCKVIFLCSYITCAALFLNTSEKKKKNLDKYFPAAFPQNLSPNPSLKESLQINISRI